MNPLSWGKQIWRGLFGAMSTAGQGQGTPQPSKGLLDYLRLDFGGWPGASAAQGQPIEREIERERVRSGPAGIILPWFLPFFDDKSGETQQMRLAYRRMMNDPNVKAAVLGKILDVAALDLNVIPVDKKDPKAKEVADFVQWMLMERLAGGVPGLVWTVLSGGLVDGYSIAEKVLGPQTQGKYAGKIVLRQLKAKVVDEDVVLQTDEFRNVVGVMGLRYNGAEEFHPSNFLIFSHLGFYQAPTGTSDLRAVYGRYWMLDTVLKLRAMGLEKRALPLLVGHYPANNPALKTSLENALSLAKSQNWFSAPDTAKIEALDIAGHGDDQFASCVRDLKEDIFLGIQGATLQALTGGRGQMRGNSLVHKDTAGKLVWFLSNALEALLNDHETGLVKDMVDLNYAVSEYPRAAFSAIELAELEEDLKIDTGLHAIGVPLSLEETYERYNRTPPQNTADVLPGAPLAPPGPAPKPGAALPTPGGKVVRLPGQPAEPAMPSDSSGIPSDTSGDSSGSAVPASEPFRGFSESWRKYLEDDAA